MPNTNYQTFHQMGQAINAVVKQATGRDAVQNIDMDHVTVAQNHYYEEMTASGSLVSFPDRVGNTPLEKCVVQIEPVQDLHGYSKPWAGGAGVNKCPTFADGTHVLSNGLTVTISNGEITVNGTPTGTGLWEETIPETRLPENGYISLNNQNATYAMALVYIMDNAQVFNTAPSVANRTVSLETSAGQNVNKLRIYFNGNGNFDNFKISPIIHVGSTPQTFVPYSNICPITGWNEVNIHVSPTTDAQDGMTYSITFPSEAGTVYGGTLTVNEDGSGTLVVDRVLAQIPSADILYASSTLAGRYFTRQNYFSSLKNGSELLCNAFLGLSIANSRDMGVVYISAGQVIFNTPFDTLENFKEWINANPIFIVYELVTPQTYTLTTEQIKTLQGQNHIWADTGNITVKFKVLKELY